MAYQKKKKFHIETPEERAWIEDKLNVYKKWNKPYKGEIVYKREGSSQEVVSTAKYSTYDELNADAANIIDELTKLNNGKKWILVSAKIVGQSIDDEEKD